MSLKDATAYEQWFTLASALRELARYDDAIVAYEEALRCRPGDAECWHRIGNCLVCLRQHEDALAAYRRALALDLWIATSNDPTGMAPNLLDRPGRFDRVFLFPLPGAPERAALFRLYAAESISDDVVSELARAADRLTGAHIREICYAVTMRCESEALSYGDALRVQLERMSERHRESRDYDRALRGGVVPGFGAG